MNMNISTSPQILMSSSEQASGSTSMSIIGPVSPVDIQDSSLVSSRSDSQQTLAGASGKHTDQSNNQSSHHEYNHDNAAHSGASNTNLNTKVKNLKTEYKSNFTPFDQYVYNEHTDSFVKTQLLQSSTPSQRGESATAAAGQLSSSNQNLTHQLDHKNRLPLNGKKGNPSPEFNVGAFGPVANDHATNEPWYREVVRRNEKANEYRYKSEVGHQSPLLLKGALSDEDLIRRPPCVTDPLIASQIGGEQQSEKHAVADPSKSGGASKHQAAIRFSPNDYKRDHLISHMANNNNFNLPKEQAGELTASSSSKISTSTTQRGRTAIGARTSTRSGPEARARSQSSRRRPTTMSATDKDVGAQPSLSPSQATATSKSHQTTPTKTPIVPRLGASKARPSGVPSTTKKTPTSLSAASNTAISLTNRTSLRPTTATTKTVATSASKSTNDTLQKSNGSGNNLIARRPPSANIKASPRTAALASSQNARSAAVTSRLHAKPDTTMSRPSIARSSATVSAAKTTATSTAQRSPVKKTVVTSLATASRTSAAPTTATRPSISGRTGSMSKQPASSSPPSTSSHRKSSASSAKPSTAGTQVKSIKTPKAQADAQEKAAAAAAAALAVGTVATAGAAAAAAAAVATNSSSGEDLSQQQSEITKLEVDALQQLETVAGNGLQYDDELQPINIKTEIGNHEPVDEYDPITQHEQQYVDPEPNLIFTTTETGNMLADEIAQAEEAANKAAEASADLDVAVKQEPLQVDDDNIISTENDNKLVDELTVDSASTTAKYDDQSGNLINGLLDGLVSAEDRFDSSERETLSLENNNNNNTNNNDVYGDSNFIRSTAGDDTYNIQQGQNYDDEPYSIMPTRYNEDGREQDDYPSGDNVSPETNVDEFLQGSGKDLQPENFTNFDEFTGDSDSTLGQQQPIDTINLQQELIKSNEEPQVESQTQSQEVESESKTMLNFQEEDKVVASDRFSTSSDGSSGAHLDAEYIIIDRKQELELDHAEPLQFQDDGQQELMRQDVEPPINQEINKEDLSSCEIDEKKLLEPEAHSANVDDLDNQTSNVTADVQRDGDATCVQSEVAVDSDEKKQPSSQSSDNGAANQHTLVEHQLDYRVDSDVDSDRNKNDDDRNQELLMNVVDLVEFETKKKQDMARRSEIAREQTDPSEAPSGEVLLLADQLTEQFAQSPGGDHDIGAILDDKQDSNNDTMPDIKTSSNANASAFGNIEFTSKDFSIYDKDSNEDLHHQSTTEMNLKPTASPEADGGRGEQQQQLGDVKMTTDNLSNYDENHGGSNDDDGLDSDEHLKLSNHLTNSDDELILEPRNSLGGHRLNTMSSSNRYNEGAGLSLIAQENRVEADMANLADGSSAEIIGPSNAGYRVEVATTKSTPIMADLSQNFVHNSKWTQNQDSDDEILDLSDDPTNVAATMSPSSSATSELMRVVSTGASGNVPTSTSKSSSSSSIAGNGGGSQREINVAPASVMTKHEEHQQKIATTGDLMTGGGYNDDLAKVPGNQGGDLLLSPSHADDA